MEDERAKTPEVDVWPSHICACMPPHTYIEKGTGRENERGRKKRERDGEGEMGREIEWEGEE